jgi:hypothetical protein
LINREKPEPQFIILAHQLSAPAPQQSLFNKLVDMCFRSPVFNAMFNHNMRESETKALNIEDLDMDTVKDMLRYLISIEADVSDPYSFDSDPDPAF